MQRISDLVSSTWLPLSVTPTQPTYFASSTDFPKPSLSFSFSN